MAPYSYRVAKGLRCVSVNPQTRKVFTNKGTRGTLMNDPERKVQVIGVWMGVVCKEEGGTSGLLSHAGFAAGLVFILFYFCFCVSFVPPYHDRFVPAQQAYCSNA